MTRQMTGAEMVLTALQDQGVEHIFGYPGGVVLPLYDRLPAHPEVRHILVRHEQGGGHMAEGYAKASGEVGVAFATSGPGATNLVTPICDAHMDSVPTVFITAQVPSHLRGTDAFQECDTIGITRSVTKHNELVTSAQDIPLAVRQAFLLATTGRPGPVLLDIPADVLDAAAPTGDGAPPPVLVRPPAPADSRRIEVLKALGRPSKSLRTHVATYEGGGDQLAPV